MHFLSFRGVRLRLPEGPAKNEPVGSERHRRSRRESICERAGRRTNQSPGLLPIAWVDPAIRDVPNLLDVTNPIAHKTGVSVARLVTS